ncbi:uncharacterized protein UDID_00153 [Ustilago sp. UG-2017a]|nr:uncharacterized protein UDID_00153 [Ustilago sp. UG-2017a]
MTTSPPPSAATGPVTPPSAKCTKRGPKIPKTPKTPVKAEGSSATELIAHTPITPKVERSTASPETSDSASTPSSHKKAEKMDESTKKVILALKMRGMPNKEIAAAVNANYKRVWAVINKAAKQGAKFSPTDGAELGQLGDTDKKNAALTLKLNGWKTKDIADRLDTKYKYLWNFFDQYQKAAGLPGVTQDPGL